MIKSPLGRCHIFQVLSSLPVTCVRQFTTLNDCDDEDVDDGEDDKIGIGDGDNDDDDTGVDADAADDACITIA